MHYDYKITDLQKVKVSCHRYLVSGQVYGHLQKTI